MLNSQKEKGMIREKQYRAEAYKWIPESGHMKWEDFCILLHPP